MDMLSTIQPRPALFPLLGAGGEGETPTGLGPGDWGSPSRPAAPPSCTASSARDMGNDQPEGEEGISRAHRRCCSSLFVRCVYGKTSKKAKGRAPARPST